MYQNNKRLFELISPIASNCGLKLITASFFGPKEFQTFWKKSGNSIDIVISDYLIDAPDRVIEDFSNTVVETITGKKPIYGETYLNWVSADEYISSKRMIYLRRSRNLTGSAEGSERDIIESLDRLLDSGLLVSESIDNSFFSWTKMPNLRKIGFCSPMMRVVGISSALDDISVPEFVLDYVVYHESIHLAQGYRPGQRAHCRAFRAEERKYPKYEDAERYLRSLKTGLK